jgi:uncharacterized protein YraI
MRNVGIAAIRRVVVFMASFGATMCVGVAMASACAWIANPSPGTVLYVRSGPGSSYQVVGSMSRGREFYGSCSTYDGGWIEVNAGQWPFQWTGVPPFDYVNSRYAYKI